MPGFKVGPGGNLVGPGGGTVGPTGARTTPSWGAVVFEVDWFNDSSWQDETANCWRVDTKRGRDYASPLTGRSRAGQLTATLNNSSGRYSSFNASSPVYSFIVPLVPVRLRSLYPSRKTLWTGYLNRVEAAGGRPPMATLHADGPIIKLSGNQHLISPAVQTGVYTGDIVGAVLDAAGYSGGRSIDGGTVPVNNWNVEAKDAYTAIQEMEECEWGFAWEDEDATLHFEGRYWRNINKTTSVATFSDDGADYAYSDVRQSDPLREIFNKFTANIQPWNTAALAVIWTLADVPFNLSPGSSITYIAKVASGYVASWTTPVVGTDITQTGVSNSDIAVSVTKGAKTMPVTLTNNGSTNASITLLQARGTAVSAGNPYQVSSQDTTSQGKYGVRTFPLVSPWLPNANYGQANCDYGVQYYKDPRPIETISVQGAKSAALFDQCVQRQISDRITLEATGQWAKLGVDQDFFIESIAHSVSRDQGLVTTFELSPAAAAVAYWILDSATYSVLGTSTIPGY